MGKVKLSKVKHIHIGQTLISGGRGMISPFTELTIGQMYTDTGYISV